MTRATPLYRRAGLAFGLIALSTTAGCAHFRNAHERVLREQGQQQADTPPPVPVAPPARPSAAPPPAAAPAPVPAPVAPASAPAPEPAPDHTAAQTARAEQKAQAARQAAQHKAERRAQKQAGKAQPKAAPVQPMREPVFVEAAPPAPARPAPAPPPVAPVSPAPLADAPAQDATPGHAIIVFANVPSPRCSSCETLKISVQPSGKVLIERGFGAQESWRYRRSLAHVRPDRAAAFAARLAALRPAGKQESTCPAPATQDQGISVEWIEGDRHDQLSIAPGCGGAALATLMHAPDLLELRQLVFPWSGAR